MKAGYWQSRTGRAHLRAFWRDLAIEMFGTDPFNTKGETLRRGR